MKYTSKYYGGYEIRIYEEDKDHIVGKIYSNNNIKAFVNESGELCTMITDSNRTSLLKKLKNIIKKADLKEIEDHTEILHNSSKYKFAPGDIVIEKDTNVVLIDEVLFIIDISKKDNRKYQCIKFVTMEDGNVSTVIVEMPIENLDANYVDIGNDKDVLKYYYKIEQYSLSIKSYYKTITKKVSDDISITNKSNDDFYNDLVSNVNKMNVSEFERDKYLEFISAAYNNSIRK